MRLSKNEYTYGQPANPAGTLSMTKIKNRLKKEAPDLLVEKFSNQRVNGVLEGASGFVSDPTTSKVVYISSTSMSPHTPDGDLLVRSASHVGEYSGGLNHFVDFDELVDTVRRLLA